MGPGTNNAVVYQSLTFSVVVMMHNITEKKYETILDCEEVN